MFEVRDLHNLPRALHLQIIKALVIERETREGAVVMNRKHEYNRCLLLEILIKDKRPTTNIPEYSSETINNDQEDHNKDTLALSLGDTQKRDTRKADIREKVRQRKRRKVEKDREKEKPTHTRTEPRKRNQNQNQDEDKPENPIVAQEPRMQARKLPEDVQQEAKLSHTQKLLREKKRVIDRPTDEQPVQPEEQNPSK